MQFTGRVLVVGDVFADKYVFGTANRLSPEAPVPVVKQGRQEIRLWGAANVAANIASLGGLVTLVGAVGRDDEGDAILKISTDFGIDSKLVRLNIGSTMIKERIIADQQVVRIDKEDPASMGAVASQVMDVALNEVKNVKAIVISDYGKGTVPCVRRIIDTANELNIPVIVDPKGIDFVRYANADYVTPNMKEFEAEVGSITSEEDLVIKAKGLFQIAQIRNLLLTRSEKGMLLARSKTDDLFTVDSLAQEVTDVTGAGDTVVAVFSAGLASGWTDIEAMNVANKAAGKVVTKIGTAVLQPSELFDVKPLTPEIASPKSEDKILRTELELVEVIKGLKESNKRLIMTNGCFDILHIGHVKYLEQASSFGDELIVAVNDDESVSNLKGTNRPINCVEDRMLMLASLSSVSYVIAFSSATPVDLYAKVRPDVLVKGGDYQESEIIGSDVVKNLGGEIKITPLVSDRSTTHLIQKIKRIYKS